ncbi:MAG TPA: hypothetical protein VJ885_16440 [Thermoanaerobaculia bacterium]|nr:hypothetical protein [Thermoanaerobaculia bacterium]
MKREYDFSKGERGKFYRPGASLNLPIYLEDNVRSYFEEKARSKGIEIGELVNEILKTDIALFETLK